MRFRTVYGVFIVLGIAGLILLDSFLFRNLRPLGSLLLMVLAAQGWQEYARITGIRGPGPKAHFGLDLLGLTGVVYFLTVAWSHGASATTAVTGWQEEVWNRWGIAILLMAAFGLVVLRDDFERYSASLIETVVGVLLLGYLFAFLVRIYHLPGWDGPILGAVFVGGVKGNDTAAYYVGKTWGKNHFLKVSPRKTLEGSIGSILFGALYFSIAGLFLHRWQLGSLFPWFGGMLFGMLIAGVSQIGDLGESLLKRVYQVKDSGAVLPEFGGVLDMIDSLVFTGFLFWELS